MAPTFKLGIDWGEKSFGIALNRLDNEKNEVIYASTVTAEGKWLDEKTSRRTEERRLRRTRKSKMKRLKALEKILKLLGLASELESFILSFCKRRGFDYADKEENAKSSKEEEKKYSLHRSDIINALSRELKNRTDRADEILHAVKPLLNCQMRPKRFLNRATSKCQWQGCKQNTPKKANSIEDTLSLELFTKLLPFFSKQDRRGFPAPPDVQKGLVGKIYEFIKEAVKVSEIYRKAPKNGDGNTKKIEEEFRKLRDGFKKEILGLLTDKADKKRFKKNIWAKKKGRMGDSLKDIVLGSPKGRQTFCRKHVKEYIDYLLRGEVAPKRDEIRESDLTRRQEILFSKLFAFIRGRLLPLTKGQGVTEITVERNAFDVVPRKVREKHSEDKLYELYWYGPRYDFKDEREMFFREFEGRCAYCNNPIDKNTYEIEHIFNSSTFPMDGYLNKVPSCRDCNKRKGPRTALEAKMPVQLEAYQAYEKYLEDRKKSLPTHFLMTQKKGLLNLLKGDNGSFWGENPESKWPGPFTEERLVHMLGRGLVSQARTQSSARMLARFLATKLEDFAGKRPRLEPFNSRYVAHIRNRFCTDFSKDIEKEHGHALDAAILSCKWPSPNILTGKERWEFDRDWYKKLPSAWPANIKEDGTLVLPEIKPVQGFEDPLKRGGFFINLTKTNWNRREISVADQTIYCAKGNKPSVRKPARDWLEDLKKKDVTAIQKAIQNIAHPNLKTALLRIYGQTKSVQEVERVFKEWLRKTVKAGLKGPEPLHPSSKARWKELREFAEGGDDIPPTVSLCLIQSGIETNVQRMRDGQVIHALRADPTYRYFLVAYKQERDHLDKQKPLVLGIKQSWQVKVVYGKKELIEKKVHLREGRAYRSGVKEKDFLEKWNTELEELLKEWECRARYKIRQGNVILYEDGQENQIQNFDKAKIRKSDFCNIKEVYSSPYSFLLKTVSKSGKSLE